MEEIRIEVSAAQLRILKARAGTTDAAEAVRAWIRVATDRPTKAQISRALRQADKEIREGKGKSFTSGRAAVEWLER